MATTRFDSPTSVSSQFQAPSTSESSSFTQLSTSIEDEICDLSSRKRLRCSTELEIIKRFFQNIGEKPTPGNKWKKKCAKCHATYSANTQNLFNHIMFNCREISKDERKELNEEIQRDNGSRSFLQSKADKALADLIVGCNLPFRLVDQPKFIEYSLSLNQRFVVPSSRTLVRNLIASQNDYTKESMLSELNQAASRSITLAFDTWTDALGRSIMAFFATLYNNLSKKNHLYALVDVSLIEHTGVKIAEIVQHAINDIGKEKINCVVSDNASDVTLSRKIIVSQNPGVISIGCMAHWINLMAKDICRDENINIRIKQTSKVIKYINKRTLLRNLLKKNSVSLQSFTEIRWYSLSSSLNSLLRNEAVIKNRLETNKVDFKMKIRNIIGDFQFWCDVSSIHDLLDKICELIGSAISKRLVSPKPCTNYYYSGSRYCHMKGSIGFIGQPQVAFIKGCQANRTLGFFLRVTLSIRDIELAF